jgi:hypothetical protein
MRDAVRAAARAAAQGDRPRAETLLDQLERWASDWPRLCAETSWRDGLTAEHYRLEEQMKALLPPYGASAQAIASVKASAQYRQMDARVTTLLRQMWAASPWNRRGTDALLSREMRLLENAMTQAARASATPEDRQAPREQWKRAVALLEQLLAYESRSRYIWKTYAGMMADQDEDLALGALVVAGRLLQRRGFDDERGDGLVDTDVDLLLRVADFEAMTRRLLPPNSQTRLDILQARARMLLGKNPAAQPPGARAPASDVLPAPTPETADLAQRPLPPPGRLEDGAGLWAPPASARR